MLNHFFKYEKQFDTEPFTEGKTLNSKTSQDKQQRTKLWELDHNYHCAIIGTCLTLDEVTKLLRSFKVTTKDISSYDIHTIIVTMISYNDYRSKKVQSYLNKKFKTTIQKTKKMDVAELIDEWKYVVKSGDLIATFWAVISHPLTTEQMKRDFYGDIHMQSHMSGASNRVDLKRLSQLENNQKKIDSETLAQQTKYLNLQAENARLLLTIQQQTEKNSDCSNQIIALTNANEHLTILNSVEEIGLLNSQLAKQENKMIFQANEIENYKKYKIENDAEVTALKEQISADNKSITEYKKEIEHLQFVLNESKSEDKCLFKKQGLCGQCVLYVGGKASLIPYYRELVESKSGVFLYHDGGLEKSSQDLSQSLNRADLVIFPSDCISHHAYWKIKNTCKKQQKPFEYLRSPGLHSLSSLLEKVMTENSEVEPA